MKSTNERDSHFFLAGWNGARRDVDATEHFQNASKTAPTSCMHQIQEPTVNQQLTIEREAFEEWATKESPDIRLDRKGDGYRYILVQDWWKVWQSSAALSATPAAVDNPTEADPATETVVTLEAMEAWHSKPTLAAAPAADAPAQTIERQRMTAGRASFFMDRFLREEKLLGPNEQAALHFVIDMLEAAAAPVVLPEPFALYDGEKWYANEEAAICSCADMAKLQKVFIESQLRALLATGGQAQANAVEQEPFGYFKAEPFGWTDCGPDDEGAVALYERPQAQADARDAEQERWMGIGKAIERACVDLPAGAEINIHLEKDAGTVTLSDCDGDEQENFPTDEGLAGVVNAAIDAAIAAAKGE